MSKAKKFIVVLIILLFALAGIAYGGGVYYFSHHYLPGTKINGVDCSFKTIPEVQAIVKQQAGVYVLAIDEKNNGREKLTAEQIGLRYRSRNRLEELVRQQHRWLWFLNLTNTFVLDKSACLEYDEDMLRQAVSSLRCMQASEVTPTRNATLVRNGNTFEVKKEVQGDNLNMVTTLQVIGDAILAGAESVNLEEKGCYVEPSITTEDEAFKALTDKVEKMMSTIITYDFGRESERVDGSVLADWLEFDDEGGCTVNRNHVAAYVVSLAQKYDEDSKSFEFRTYDLRTITMNVENSGWIIDQKAEVEALIQDIENGNIDVREPMYSSRGINRKNEGAGDTYVEIDLSNQRMVLYNKGTLMLDTSIVSGNPNQGTPTPTGCFPVGKKAKNTQVTGIARDVDYWIPFTGFFGIVGASWRQEFGSDLYLMIGSDGNIECSNEDAHILYEYLYEGDPVIIY